MGPSRTLIRVFILILIGALFAACGDDDNGGGSDTGLTVVASTSIIGALAEQVGGERVRVETLIGRGVDPHTFEMTPGDVRTLADADLVLIIGLELDDYLIEDVQSTNADADVIVVTDGVELLELGEHHDDEHEAEEHEDADHEEHEDEGEHEEEHEHGAFDPHVWQDALRVKVMVQNIAAALSDADPDHASEYRANAADYQATLDETHAEIQALIDEIPAERRKLVTNHEAFAYFADRYGLEIVGTVITGGSSEADPSAGDIAALTELIEAEDVPAIFTEALLDPTVADALASDTGVQIVHGLYSDQVGEPGSGAETVHAMLLANATKISEALRQSR